MHSALDGGALSGGALGSGAALGSGGCSSWRWRRCYSRLGDEVALDCGGGVALDGNVALESTRGRSGVLGAWRGDVGGGSPQ